MRARTHRRPHNTPFGAPSQLPTLLPLSGEEESVTLEAAQEWRLRALPEDARTLVPWRRVLAARGLSAGEVLSLIDRSSTLGDPFMLPDMRRATARLATAHQQRERVAVHGDSDADGLTATAILVEALHTLGFALPIGESIPERDHEGFGLSVAAVERLARAGATLIVTVDTGSSSDEGLLRAHALGLAVIVTDHHQVPATTQALLLDNIAAFVNPARLSNVGHGRELAGSGVSFLLAYALAMTLLGTAEGQKAVLPFLDLAAVGAIADMVPLTGQTRVLVRHGLAALRKGSATWQRRPGLAALLESADLDPANLSASDVAFQIAPRLNAAGRDAQAGLAYDLLRSRDHTLARRYAADLDAINTQRKKDVAAGAALAVADLLGRYGALSNEALPAALVLVGEWPAPGIKGLIAGKIAALTNRPTLVGSLTTQASDQGSAVGQALIRGSGRAPHPGAPILPLLEATPALWHSYGGHAMACGFACLESNASLLQEAFQAAAEELLPPSREPALDCDALLAAEEISHATATDLVCLEPTGQGNPAPLFLVTDLLVIEARAVGSDKRTLKLELAAPSGLDDGLAGRPAARARTIAAVAFGKGGLVPLLPPGTRVDVAANLGLNTYPGVETPQLVVRDLRPAGGTGTTRETSAGAGDDDDDDKRRQEGPF